MDLAIPQHRIVYFKYKDTKVWDKTQRLDLIFNSTIFQGDFKGKTIEDVMQSIDDRYVKKDFKSYSIPDLGSVKLILSHNLSITGRTLQLVWLRITFWKYRFVITAKFWL